MSEAKPDDKPYHSKSEMRRIEHMKKADDKPVFAADEKLRAELASAKAEIEKLRKTLEKIGEMECPYGEGGCDSDEKRGVAWQALENERKNNGHR